MTSFTKRNAIITLTFYAGLAVTSFHGINVLGTTWQAHDNLYIKTFNCTCLTETDFRCLKEAVRVGIGIHRVKCNAIEKHATPLRYEFCDCGAKGQSRCLSPSCYVIDHSVAVPDGCDDEKCNAFDGLQMWMSAAKIGIVIGPIAAIILLLSICKAVKTSEKNIDIPSFYVVNFLALVPPAVVAFSLATTEVQKYYANFELNAWSSVMAIGLGVPLCGGWIYCVVTTYFAKS